MAFCVICVGRDLGFLAEVTSLPWMNGRMDVWIVWRDLEVFRWLKDEWMVERVKGLCVCVSVCVMLQGSSPFHELEAFEGF